MLTKRDLQAIKEVVDERLDSRLDEKLDSKLNPIKDEIESIKQQIKPIKSIQRNVRKINKNFHTMLDMLNRDDVFLQRSVRRIEEHLKLSPLEQKPPQN